MNYPDSRHFLAMHGGGVAFSIHDCNKIFRVTSVGVLVKRSFHCRGLDRSIFR